jgi:hypothetical protein
MSNRIGFSTSKTSWISRIIRWFTGGKSSHTAVVYWDTDFERDMIMGATDGGFKITPFSHYEKSLVAIYTPKYPIDVGLKKAVDWLGEGYDYGGLFGMAWVELGRWLKRKWRNPWRDSKTMFCSEAVARIMDSGYPGTKGWDAQSIDPEMLIEFFEKEQFTS